MLVRAAILFESWANDFIFVHEADDQSGQLDDYQCKNNSPPNHVWLKAESGHCCNNGDRIENWCGEKKTDDIGGL